MSDLPRKVIETLQQGLSSQRKHIYDILTQIPDSQLNWKPQNERNSIGNLIEHLTGSERYWIKQAITGIDVKRQRDLEFEPTIRKALDLEKAYNSMKNETLRILEELDDQQLNEEREVQDRVYTVHGILLHVIEHSYYHLGQIRYIQGLLKGDEFNPVPS